MFYMAQALLEGEGLAFSKHSAVIAALGRYFVKTGRLPDVPTVTCWTPLKPAMKEITCRSRP